MYDYANLQLDMYANTLENEVLWVIMWAISSRSLCDVLTRQNHLDMETLGARQEIPIRVERASNISYLKNCNYRQNDPWSI